MSIKFKIVLFFCIQSLLLVILFVDLAWMLENAHHLGSLQERRYQLRGLAEGMRQSSDDLTRMARSIQGDVQGGKLFAENRASTNKRISTIPKSPLATNL